MYLKDAPVVYKKDDKTISVYYSAQARDLEGTGWTKVPKINKESAQQQQPKEAPKAIAVSAPEVVEITTEVESDLQSLTKSELISIAEEKGIEVKAANTKAEIIEALTEG
jgi:hypothetical protein